VVRSPGDTIVALSTPAGLGAIAVIRLSGAEAFRIGDAVFKGKRLSLADSHTIHFGQFFTTNEIIDEVVASVFRGPTSYTGENVLEISCHGSSFIIGRILQVLVASGARPAEPGEFTLRAFLNGKLDLSQAEAVADLVATETAASHKIALQQLRGGFSHELQLMRDQLVRFASLLELELDFSEEDVEFANRQELQLILHELKATLEKLIDSFFLGNVLKKGIPVAIVGKPNAGKSTLLNRLLNDERAIVSEIPGTTRDTLEEHINIESVPFLLIDTAGLRDSQDAIERIGVERARQKMKQASIIIYLFDPNEVHLEELAKIVAVLKVDNPGTSILVTGNKADQHEIEVLDAKYSSVSDVVWISARDNQNIDLLKAELLKFVNLEKLNSGELLLTNPRHLDALNKALESVTSTLSLMEGQEKSELLAFEIKNALYHLGLITGEVTNEDLLDSIFSKFCIGK